jgi:hypothetical protein
MTSKRKVNHNDCVDVVIDEIQEKALMYDSCNVEEVGDITDAIADLCKLLKEMSERSQGLLGTACVESDEISNKYDLHHIIARSKPEPA